MLTDKQLESNRRNASKSCGPRSAEGKRISSQNSFKTGLYSQALVTRGEKLEDFETLRDEYYAHHCPQTPEERETLDTIIRLAWQLRRYAMVETHSWNLEIKRAELHAPADLLEGNLYGSAFYGADQRFARLHRIQAATQRQFKEALHDLELLKAARPVQPVEEEPASADLGFVPSNDVGQALSPANPDAAGTPVVLAVLPPAPPEIIEKTPHSYERGFVPLTPVQPALPPANATLPESAPPQP
ncbi:MAG TPA: hypothetical protein VH640_16530 [Bryobacteraceae bacterium]